MPRGPERQWKRTTRRDDGGTHECPAPWCDRRVARTMFACPLDWRYLPRDLQRAIWDGWHNESDGGASHRAAMANAIQFYRDNPR
jgi:hypothetical protein